jgi:hypothetical protein
MLKTRYVVCRYFILEKLVHDLCCFLRLISRRRISYAGAQCDAYVCTHFGSHWCSHCRAHSYAHRCPDCHAHRCPDCQSHSGWLQQWWTGFG